MLGGNTLCFLKILWFWVQTNTRRPNFIIWWLPKTLKGSGTKCGGEGKKPLHGCLNLPPQHEYLIRSQGIRKEEMMKESRKELLSQHRNCKAREWSLASKSGSNPSQIQGRAETAACSQSKQRQLDKKWLETNGIAVELTNLTGTHRWYPELASLGHRGRIIGILMELSADGL